MYYGWKKKLLSSATKIFEEKSKQGKAQQEGRVSRVLHLKPEEPKHAASVKYPHHYRVGPQVTSPQI